MSEDQDNAGEVVAGAVRVALTAAGQLAEQAARRGEAALREAERNSAARVATLQSQLAAERELALRSVRDVIVRGDAATVEDVLRAWEQTHSWDDPTMAIERSQLEDRIRERFAVDARRLPAGQSSGQQATAVTLATRDIDLQADDAHYRGAEDNQVAALHHELVSAGVNEEVAAARALAAESHPVPVAEAARKPDVALARLRLVKKEGKARELQGPGR